MRAATQESGEGRGEGSTAAVEWRVLCFAYGSNLSSARLREAGRCPGARFAGVALLRGWRIAFDKPSGRWGGNAANLRPEPAAETWGVLWEIDDAELRQLDAGERGYERVPVEVEREGEPVPAQAYVAPAGAEACPPRAYLDVLLAGGREHCLPAGYLEGLGRLRSREDPP